MSESKTGAEVLKGITAIARHEVVARIIILRQNVEPYILEMINYRPASIRDFRDQQRGVVSADRGARKNIRNQRSVIGRRRVSGKESLKYTYFVSAAGAAAR